VPARPEPKVFFPWERRQGVRSLLGRSGARQTLVAVGVVVVVALLGRREQRERDVIATRARITTAMQAIEEWRADHDLGCPGSLADLVSAGYLHQVPRDAWGRPLRVVCPGRKHALGFDVSSDGPDGDPGGPDRVE
jgi:general secretion pathway protein G